MLSAADTITRLGGIARGADLQRLGFTRQSLARAVAQGSIERMRHGVFASSTVSDDCRTAIAHGGALTCESALRHSGVWVLPRAAGAHVWLASHQHPLAHNGCRCRSHYYRGNPPLGVVDVATAAPLP